MAQLSSNLQKCGGWDSTHTHTKKQIYVIDLLFEWWHARQCLGSAVWTVTVLSVVTVSCRICLGVLLMCAQGSAVTVSPCVPALMSVMEMFPAIWSHTCIRYMVSPSCYQHYHSYFHQSFISFDHAARPSKYWTVKQKECERERNERECLITDYCKAKCQNTYCNQTSAVHCVHSVNI